MPENNSLTGFGPMGERSLHEDLKRWYALPDDRFEVEVAGYVIDIVRDDLLIEIQTTGFSSLKKKLFELTENHPVRLVHPLAREKWIVHLAASGLERLDRRKSPQHKGLVYLFNALVSIPELMRRGTFALEVVVIQEEAVRRHIPEKSTAKRRKFVPFDRRLLSVEGRRLYETPEDLKTFIPPSLPRPFTNAQLAEAIGQRRRLAERITYCLRKMNALRIVGKEGNALLHAD